LEGASISADIIFITGNIIKITQSVQYERGTGLPVRVQTVAVNKRQIQQNSSEKQQDEWFIDIT
jgi:hypothetical protein